ncbi:hypothetical protein Taro_030350 [Colocasia esculenta]|uniref:Uncharacterized protein n=1 Tax=Colocasia esculenta TaxID=4460 RepID=A0A843VVW0_COLES|nr:hypothetical protein [Colocasia esculenta]
MVRLLASRKLLQLIKSAGEALLGQSQEGAEHPPRSPPSGLLDDLHSKETSGRSSPSVQLASCRGRWPDPASDGEERAGEGRSGFNIWERPLSHSQGDKMALRAVGDSSPMGELPCFRNFWLCNACRSEK